MLNIAKENKKMRINYKKEKKEFYRKLRKKNLK